MTTYEVTGTDERERLGPNGQPAKVYIVYLTTKNNVRGSVEVKLIDWNKDKLKEILTAKAVELDLAWML